MKGRLVAQPLRQAVVDAETSLAELTECQARLTANAACYRAACDEYSQLVLFGVGTVARETWHSLRTVVQAKSKELSCSAESAKVRGEQLLAHASLIDGILTEGVQRCAEAAVAQAVFDAYITSADEAVCPFAESSPQAGVYDVVCKAARLRACMSLKLGSPFPHRRRGFPAHDDDFAYCSVMLRDEEGAVDVREGEDVVVTLDGTLLSAHRTTTRSTYLLTGSKPATEPCGLTLSLPERGVLLRSTLRLNMVG